MQAPTLETRTKISATHLWFVHNLTLHRIARGYTQQEFNFLLGLPDDYIQQAESFAVVPHKLVTLVGLAAEILRCHMPALLVGELPLQCDLEIEYQSFAEGGRLWHEAWAGPGEHRWRTEDGMSMIYKLSEVTPAPAKQLEVNAVRAVLHKLIKQNWFSAERDAWEITEEVFEYFGPAIRVAHIMAAVNWMLEEELLVRREEDGFWVYALVGGGSE